MFLEAIFTSTRRCQPDLHSSKGCQPAVGREVIKETNPDRAKTQGCKNYGEEKMIPKTSVKTIFLQFHLLWAKPRESPQGSDILYRDLWRFPSRLCWAQGGGSGFCIIYHRGARDGNMNLSLSCVVTIHRVRHKHAPCASPSSLVKYGVLQLNMGLAYPPACLSGFIQQMRQHLGAPSRMCVHSRCSAEAVTVGEALPHENDYLESRVPVQIFLAKCSTSSFSL